MPDGALHAFSDVSSYIQGCTTACPTFFPASRRSTSVYPAIGALAITNYVIPAAPSGLTTPNYAEFGVTYSNRNSGFVGSRISFETP